MTKNNRSTLLLILILVAMIGCKHQPKNTDESTGAQRLDLLLDNLYKKGEFNGNVLVVKNGQKFYEKSFGFADSSKTLKLSSDFRFGVGSIYKEFPAVAIMQLSEDGKIDLDDFIHEYLPHLPDWSKSITIRNLLQYSSGLPRIDFEKYFSENQSITDTNILDDIMDIQELEFKPGNGYLYSNNNPFLLIKIVEKISGQGFNNYAREKLFAPFNLKNTVFKEQYPYTDKTDMALPFNSDWKQDEYKINAPTILLCSTATDLYNWLNALHSYAVINKESLNLLTQTAKIDNEDMQAPLGNCVLKDGEITEHTHHGSMGNYECLIERFSQEELTIIILTNQKNSNVFSISEDIKTIITTNIKE